MKKVLWGGRFKKEMDPRLKHFSYSMLEDSDLLCAELCVNEAYVKMLAKVRLLTASEKTKLLRGIRNIGRSWKPGDACRYYRDYEDIHTWLQSQLEKEAGAVAKKIHTGRSRNDLVVTSTRFYVRGQLREIERRLTTVQLALVKCAQKAGETVIPGFTHLQKAQPVLLAHHFLAYVDMLNEDRSRICDARNRLNVLPLGSAALAGSSLKLDRDFLARELGFDRVSRNSLAAVSDRAFLTEALSGLAILWMHLSRLSEDMILWNCEAFGFITLDDAFATGSSLMPQKKNPDVFELIRGRSAVIFGELVALLGIQKGLPLAYNRDLQEDKPAAFRAMHRTLAALEVLAPALTSITFNTGAMAKAVEDDNLYATDLLEYLVRKGVAFSDAHQTVGQVVRTGAEQGVRLRDLSLRTWKQFSKVFDADVYDLFDARASVRGKKTSGSTHPRQVKAEIQNWERQLAEALKSLRSPKA